MKKFRLDNRKKTVLTLALLFVVLLGLVGSFAWFSSNINNKNQTANLSTGTMRLKFADNDPGINKQMIIGETVVKKFTITNKGTLDASLSLDFKDLVNTYMNGSLSYNLTYSETEDGEYKTLIEETNMPVSREGLSQTIASEISVPGGTGEPEGYVTYYYNLAITYNSTDVDQASEHDAIFTTGFDVGQPIKYRYYTLTVDPNGGTWGEYTTPQVYQLQNKDTKEIIGTPMRTGYTFAGWKLKGVSSTYDKNTFKMGISNAILTAQWRVNNHTLTINPNGGTYEGETSISIDYGSSTTINTPTSECYTFNGWTVSGGKLSNNNTFTLTEDKDVTLSANWTINLYSYKVIHRQMNIDGNEYTEVETENLSANYGEKKTPEVKTYPGFTSPSEKTITIGVDETQNVVTYDYTRNKYSLTIKPNKGSYNGSTTNTVIENIYYGATYDLKTPTRDGNTFLGWSAEGGAVSEDYRVFTMSDAKDSIITAEWSANSYDYTVNHKRQANTGENNYSIIDRDNDIVKGNGAFGTNIPLDQKTYTDFTYHGVEDGSATTISSTVENNIANLLYNRKQYELTITPNGGTYNNTTDSTVENMYYEATKSIPDPEREGYTFTGWTKSGSGTLSNSNFTMGSGEATLTANWEVNSYGYTVKYYQQNANDDNYTLKDTVTGSTDYGGTIPVDENKYPTNQFTYSSKSGATTVNTNETNNVVNVYYNRKTYILTMDPNNETGTSTVTLKYYQTYTIPIPIKKGYWFQWTVDGSGSMLLSIKTFRMGTANTTMTVEWFPEDYDAIFNANGGTVDIQSKIVTYDAEYGELPIPTYEGYNFLGWYTEKDSGTQVTAETTVTTANPHTLWAHWERAAGTDVTLEALGKTAKTSGPASFGKNNPATTDETKDGLYPMEDDYGTSYYYRGAVEDNYLKFGGFFWRIIRVNGDGSIRMIYDGTVAHKNRNGAGPGSFTLTSVNGSIASTDRFINSGAGIAYNTNYNDAKYVGYMYGGTSKTAPSTSKSEAQTNTYDSTIKDTVDAWYEGNIKKNAANSNQDLTKYLGDNLFCNDRSTPPEGATWWRTQAAYEKLGYEKNTTPYGGFGRFFTTDGSWNSSPSPNFKCDQKNDRFTVSDTSKGNGALTYPIALITVDEIVAAGAISGQGSGASNYYYYLNKSSNIWYWLLSPYYYNYNYANVFGFHNFGYLQGGNVGDTSGTGAVDPVINLSAEYSATLTGSGTATDPYMLPGVQ